MDKKGFQRAKSHAFANKRRPARQTRGEATEMKRGDVNVTPEKILYTFKVSYPDLPLIPGPNR